MISHCRYALFNEPEESVKTDRSVGPMGATQTPTERSKGQWQSCNCSVRPDCCGRGSAPGVTNGTLEPNCNTTSVVGPPNHSGCPTSSIRFQIPGDVTVQLRPSGGSGVWHGLTTNTNTFSHARRCTNKEKNRKKKPPKKYRQMDKWTHTFTRVNVQPSLLGSVTVTEMGSQGQSQPAPVSDWTWMRVYKSCFTLQMGGGLSWNIITYILGDAIPIKSNIWREWDQLSSSS